VSGVIHARPMNRGSVLIGIRLVQSWRRS